jgi:hypothetical protein
MTAATYDPSVSLFPSVLKPDAASDTKLSAIIDMVRGETLAPKFQIQWLLCAGREELFSWV